MHCKHVVIYGTSCTVYSTGRQGKLTKHVVQRVSMTIQAGSTDPEANIMHAKDETHCQAAKPSDQ